MGRSTGGGRVIIIGGAEVSSEARLLAEAGYQVEAVESLEKAAQALQEGDAAAVLSSGSLLDTALDGARAAEAQRRSRKAEEQRRWLQAIVGSVPAGIALFDGTDLRVKWANRGFRDLLGETTPAGSLVGRRLDEILNEPEAARLGDALSAVAATGTEHLDTDYAHTCPVRGVAYWHLRIVPIHYERGEPPADVMALALDASEHVIDRARLEMYADQLATARAESEQRAAQLQSLFAHMADGIALLDADGRILLTNEPGREILGVSETELVSWRDLSRYALDGRVMPLDEVPFARALMGEVVTDARCQADTPRGRMALSISAAPVRDGSGRVIGVTNVFRDITEQVDLERQQLALYERERHIAEVLQRALVPSEIPRDIAGAKLAVRYLSALTEAEVGGDFYDVFDLSDGLVALVIGDVAGKGLQAAMQVSAVRYIIRSYAYADSSPSSVLTQANAALSRLSDDDDMMITALVAVLNTGTGVITYASAGHEAPFVLRHGGIVDNLTMRELPLGVVHDARYTEESRLLGPGDRVVLVTDGITEARRPGPALFGRDGVIDCLRSASGSEVEETAEGLLRAAMDYAGGKLQDDAAILVIERSD